MVPQSIDELIQAGGSFLKAGARLISVTTPAPGATPPQMRRGAYNKKLPS